MSATEGNYLRDHLYGTIARHITQVSIKGGLPDPGLHDSLLVVECTISPGPLEELPP